MLSQRLTDRRRLDSAAAESQHRRALPVESVESPVSLDHAKACLAFLAKEVRDRTLKGALDLAVEIDQLSTGLDRHLGADRRLPRAHEPDERDVPV